MGGEANRAGGPVPVPVPIGGRVLCGCQAYLRMPRCDRPTPVHSRLQSVNRGPVIRGPLRRPRRDRSCRLTMADGIDRQTELPSSFRVDGRSPPVRLDQRRRSRRSTQFAEDFGICEYCTASVGFRDHLVTFVEQEWAASRFRFQAPNMSAVRKREPSSISLGCRVQRKAWRGEITLTAGVHSTSSACGSQRDRCHDGLQLHPIQRCLPHHEAKVIASVLPFDMARKIPASQNGRADEVRNGHRALQTACACLLDMRHGAGACSLPSSLIPGHADHFGSMPTLTSRRSR